MSEVKTIKQEAKELVNGIYQPLGYLGCNVSSDKMWEYAKERAVEIVEHFIAKMPEGSSNWLHHLELTEEIKNL